MITIDELKELIDKYTKEITQAEALIEYRQMQIDDLQTQIRDMKTSKLRDRLPFQENNVVGLFKGSQSVRGIIVGINESGDNWLWRRLKKKDSKPLKKIEELPIPSDGEEYVKLANTYGEYRRKYGIWT